MKKLLQQKLNKELSWAWNPSNSKVVQNFKKLCKKVSMLNLANECDDLI